MSALKVFAAVVIAASLGGCGNSTPLKATSTATGIPSSSSSAGPTPKPSASSKHSASITRPQMVTVPKVVGQASLTAAEHTLTKDGLSVGTVRRLIASEPPFGVVVQSPAAGSQVPVGTSVSLTDVSEAGIPLSPVPDVRGLGDPAATTQLQQMGFHVVVRVNSTGGIKPGDVMRQTPSPGTAIAANGTVTIWISPGIAIPDVVGVTVTAASKALQEAGFSSLVIDTRPGGKAAGTVLSQSPRGGAWGDVEETVTLTVVE